MSRHNQPKGTRLVEVGKTYTKVAIYDLLDLPEGNRGGDWLNGYHDHDGTFSAFANVGTAGRTGHDYANVFDGDDLLWFAKKPAKLG